MFQIRSIKNDSRIDEDRLLEAHRLARVVFEGEDSESGDGEVDGFVVKGHRNMDLELWREKLSGKDANILYVVRCDGGVSSTGVGLGMDRDEVQPRSEFDTTATTPNEPILGIFLTYPRSRDGLDSYHIFISAVHPLARGQGIFSILLDATKEFARSVGYQTLTVSTLPERFARMYGILRREGSGWEVVKWEENGEEEGGRKVVMKLGI